MKLVDLKDVLIKYGRTLIPEEYEKIIRIPGSKESNRMALRNTDRAEVVNFVKKDSGYAKISTSISKNGDIPGVEVLQSFQFHVDNHSKEITELFPRLTEPEIVELEKAKVANNIQKILSYKSSPIRILIDKISVAIPSLIPSSSSIQESDIRNNIRQLLPLYKAHIQSPEYDEIYKWKALANFSQHWDIDAPDFTTIFELSFQPPENNLWTGNNYYPRAMIVNFLKNDPEEIRRMFRQLFNESIPLDQRITKFLEGCDAKLDQWNKIGGKNDKEHYHSDRMISVYLAFHYPEKYYLYKYNMVRDFSEKVGYKPPVRGSAVNNLKNYFSLAQIVKEVLEEDGEILQYHDALKDKSCFADTDHTLLTQDFIYITSSMPTPPTLPKVKDVSPFQFSLNQILYGPPGTGKTYNSISMALQIVEELNTEQLQEKYSTREQIKKAFDDYIIKGRIAFCTFHQSFSYEDFIEGIKPIKPAEEDKFLKYDIQDGIFKKLAQQADTYKEYDVKQAKEVELTYEDFDKTDFFKMSLGDTKDTEDNEIYDYCIKNNCVALGWGDDIDFTNIKDEKEIKQLITDQGELQNYAITAVSIFKLYIKPGSIILVSYGNTMVRAIARVTGEYEFNTNTGIRYNHFRSVEWLLKDVSIPVSEFYQKNLNQKTIYTLNKSFLIKDFFQPKPEQQRIMEASELKRNHVLIIDEINRGNISQIFGELITLIEPDKRKGGEEALSLTLPYSKSEFTVPDNLYLIGTMNTADRSVEALDTALRRRFSFVEMPPQPELVSPIALIVQLWEKYVAIGWKEEPYKSKAKKLYELLEPSFINDLAIQDKIHESLPNDFNVKESVPAFAEVSFTGVDPEKLLRAINKRIQKLIDKDHCIGHSYFMGLIDCIEPKNELRNIFSNKVIPLLQEYFYGDFGKMELVIGEDFFLHTDDTISEDAESFFAKSSYEAKEDLMTRRVYKLKNLHASVLTDKEFLKLIKSIYMNE